MMKRIFKKRINKLLKRYEARALLVSENANLFGIESKGIKQIKGNGVLILTDNSLFFGMWTPKREFEIPIKRITRIEKVKNQLHRSILRNLLKVEFFDEDNQIDSVVWYVRDLDIWIENLQKIKQK